MSNKQLPTLRPDDSHMESLIEAAIQGHADTRDAMRWLVRQLVPVTQPAEVTDEQIESEFQQCGGKWNGDQWVIEDADLHPFVRAILALRPVQVPMTDDQREHFNAGYEAAQRDALVCHLPPNGWHCTRIAGHDGPCAAIPSDDESLVKGGMDRLRTAHHGITAQAKKKEAP